MKILKLAVCLLIVLIATTACRATSGAGDNFAKALENWDDQPKWEQTDVVLLENGDFSDELGFEVTGYPETEELAATTFSVINGWIGQVDIRTPDKQTFGLRVAKADDGLLIYTYQEKHNKDAKTREIAGVEVSAGGSEADGTVYTWKDGDFQYALHSAIGTPTDAQLETIVGGVKAKAKAGAGSAAGAEASATETSGSAA